MKLKVANLNHDISCLISAFNNSKKTGKFEVNSTCMIIDELKLINKIYIIQLRNIFLKEISLDRLNGCLSTDDSSKRVHFADSVTLNNSPEYTKLEISHREDIINSLQQELKVLRSQYESLLNGVSV